MNLQVHSKFYRALQWVTYPVTLILSVYTFYFFHSLGFSYSISALISSMISVFAIMALEWLLPFEPSWRPSLSDVNTDAVFMVLIQLVLPKALAVLIAANVLRFIDSNHWAIGSVWPIDAPALMQVLLMMVVADFFRYWLHRYCHENLLLWRFHAVHHSPQKLYWLNVGRFHPVDKALQYLCDSLPFILIGVSEEILMLYFSIYAIKGFFQHSNVDVKLGYLNYLISGPELHRWHHSKVIKESNQNYGNNLIIWDLVFGTYFLPEGRRVSILGLLNREYPMGFWAQMKAPFIKGLDKSADKK
jgi:sterol desaturase/sphingolipid hydroxylase (fatty acid hydroxylase superfamily)